MPLQNKYKVEYDGDRLPSIYASSESAARLLAKETHNIGVSDYLKIFVSEV